MSEFPPILSSCHYRDRGKFLPVHEKISAALESKGYRYIGQGAWRTGFLSPCRRWVVKVPRTEDSSLENEIEATAYKDGETRIAKCRLLPIKVGDIPVSLLIMERIQPALDGRIPTEIEPDWTYTLQDGQYGVNSRGKYKIYDFNVELPRKWPKIHLKYEDRKGLTYDQIQDGDFKER